MNVAKLAGGEVAVGGAHGWAEGAADDGTVLIEIAGAGCGIERRAGFGVSERAFGFITEEKGIFVVFSENACRRVAGEKRREPRERFGGALPDTAESVWVGLFESVEAFAETVRVFVGDGEDSVATLGASGAAGEMCAAAFGG